MSAGHATTLRLLFRGPQISTCRASMLRCYGAVRSFHAHHVSHIASDIAHIVEWLAEFWSHGR
jgi:hypothetical protein